MDHEEHPEREAPAMLEPPLSAARVGALATLIIRYRDLFRFAIGGLGFVAILHGIAIIAGGNERWGGPSYLTAVDLAELAATSPAAFWGVSSVLAGVLALLPVRRLSQCGLTMITVWSLFLAISHLISANVEPLAGVTGIFSNVFVAGAALGLMILRLLDRQV